MSATRKGQNTQSSISAYISTISAGLRTKGRSLQSRRSRKSGKCGRKSKKPKRKRAALTTGHIQGSTGRETLKSSGSMTVSRRGNTGRGKRRRPPHSPHCKQNNRQPRGDFPTTGNPLFRARRKEPPMAEQTPDSIITTQRNGQTIVAELFFNHSSTETFRDKLLKTILADSSRLSASDGQESEKTEILR